MNIILCGPPTSGKTTLGNQLALKLNCPFIDTDRLIEQAHALQSGHKMSCRQIYQLLGEKQFRVLENQQIKALAGAKGAVIAIGGGALENSENIRVLQKIGLLVCLKVPLDSLWERICVKGTPAYLTQNVECPKKSFEALLQKRMPIYQKAASVVVDTMNLTEQETILLICELLEEHKNG